MNKNVDFSFRINNEIRNYDSVRIVGNDIESEVMSLDDAKKMSKKLNLDLVEINSKVNPPILRLCNYEKFIYELKKNKKKNKPQNQTKEIQLSVSIAKHDLETKANQARKFLNQGDKVKAILMMKGRELNRREENKKSILLLQTAGIDNINADIIFSTPKDSFKIVKRDLKKLIKLNVTHFSTYSLQLEKKTILYKLYTENKFKLIDEDLDSDIYQNICNYLKENDFIQYEISNFSKNNSFKSLHNLTYWNNEKYLGIGAAASYYIENTRYTNVNNLNKYFEGIDNNKLNYLEENELVLSEMMFEEVMLGLRKTEGINLAKFKEKFNIDLIEKYPSLMI